MGLDVYVGPLSRYYTGQWETIIQQYARQTGMDVQVVRPPSSSRTFIPRLIERLRPKGSIFRDLGRWQADLTKITGIPVRWDDTFDREYFTDKPAWDCYGALLMWAAYHEHGATNYPASAENWHEDPIISHSANELHSKYRQLLANTEIWLPIDLEQPFSAKMLSGGAAIIGSSIHLDRQLRELNESTWQAGEDTISKWRDERAEFGAPLEKSAKFGFAVMHQLADLAVQHRLPMKLDY